MQKLIFYFALSFCLFFPMKTIAKEKPEEELLHYKNLIELTSPQLYKHGESFFQNGNLDSALIYYNILFSRYTDVMTLGEKYLCAISLYKAGNIYYQKISYPKAMECFLKSLRISEECEFEDILSELYKNIGNVHSSYADFEQSSAFYEKALYLAQKRKNVPLQNKILNNLIGAYCFTDALDKADHYYALLAANTENGTRYQFDLMMDKGLIDACKRKDRAAISHYIASADYAKSQKLGLQCIGAAYSCLARLYDSKNMPDSALYYLHINEIEARRTNQTDLLVETLKDLASIYEKKKNLSKSLAYKSEYLDLSSDIFNQSEFNSLKNAQFLYEMDKSNSIINSLNLDKKEKEMQIAMQRQWLLTITVGFCLFIVLLAIVYRQKQRLRHAYNDLFDRNNAYLENEIFFKKRLADMEEKLKSERQQTASPTLETGKNIQTEEISERDGTGITFSPQQQEKLLSDILHVMEHTYEFCNSDFNIDKLAGLIGSNSRYVSQIINEVYSKNFRTFLNEYRIKEAMLRLIDVEHYGHFTIKAISESVGYKSQANFISVFTRITGIKPSMYQKISLERQ